MRPEPLTALCSVVGCKRESRLTDDHGRKLCVQHWRESHRQDAVKAAYGSSITRRAIELEEDDDSEP